MQCGRTSLSTCLEFILGAKCVPKCHDLAYGITYFNGCESFFKPKKWNTIVTSGTYLT